MPFCNIPGGVRLFYEQYTSTSTTAATASTPAPPSAALAGLSLDSPSSPLSPSDSNTSGSHTQRPTLLIIAPFLLNATFMSEYVEAFREEYDVCVLELRDHGRTQNLPSVAVDHWVSAADVASAMETLHLAPSHILGAGVSAFQSALKLAILFPNLVLSLNLVGAATLFAPPRNLDAFVEVVQGWTHPADEDEFEDVIGGCTEFLLGDRNYDGAAEMWDRVTATLVRKYNPYTARSIFGMSAPTHLNPRLSPELLAGIRLPVLVIHGNNDYCYSVEEVREQSAHFTGAAELQIEIIETGPHLLAVTHASDVISLMRPFLERHTPSSLPPYVPIDSHSALRTVAKIAGDPKIANRNPHNPESFSMVTAEERAQAAKNLEEMERVEQTCELDLPMRFEREDWEPLRPGEDPEHDTRWTWSTRESYGRPSSPHSFARSSISAQGGGTGKRPTSTFSLAENINVGVQVDKDEKTTTTTVGKAGGGLLDGLPVHRETTRASVGRPVTPTRTK